MASLMSKRQQARNEKALQDLLHSVPGNNMCADCNARNPGQWQTPLAPKPAVDRVVVELTCFLDHLQAGHHGVYVSFFLWPPSPFDNGPLSPTPRPAFPTRPLQPEPD